ncbi:hypothetical protein SDRG_01696 [Saprolegnia diclina VS20]|uniref:START domain-containing protein n=1 Tax=Saprolegnia diclina (strain VS20) TaxID=1156394 RepID=T0SCN7_SAPDV|nr:hypothetical protein SDRG_01696 [Saprolegnia diclina VS20]EQC40612.1 hypothetical protein SDRG_01696 [Saprolegnia diclina VS20]|eukprot:XP_008605456.1 hypothetical protein SDRG_01696 [Saprolegnia diclina VS20]
MGDEGWQDGGLFGADILADCDLASIDGSVFAAENKALGASSRERQRLALQRHRQRQRDELVFLKRKVDELQAELEQLTRDSELRDILQPPSKWEKLAKQERVQRAHVLLENRELKEAISEQVEFAQSLAALIRKSPTPRYVCVDAHEQWKHYKLVADPIARRAAYHAIVNRDYASQTSAFIEAKLIEPVKEGRQYIPVLRDGLLEVHTIVFTRLPAPLAEAASAIWDVLRGVFTVASVQGVYRVLEEVDADTLYVGSLRHYSLGKIQRRIILKRFREGDSRVVVVARNVHEDEIFTFDPRLGLAHEVSWMVLQWDAASQTTEVKYFQKAIPFFAEAPLLEGHIMGVPVSQHIMEMFASHSLGFEQAMRALLHAKTTGDASALHGVL